MVFLVKANYLKKMKDKEYIVNLDEYLETETFWIALNKYKNKNIF